jgi:hypothetical protein
MSSNQPFPITFMRQVAALFAILASPAMAQGAPDDPASAAPAAGTEIWASRDSEGTEVLKVLGRALWHFEGRERYAGIAVEHAWFDPSNGAATEHNRVYLDAADRIGAGGRWRARIGTDGHTILGSAELRQTDWSRSVFVEREIVETDQGLRRGIYYTLAGASTDIVIDDSNTVAVTAGVQEFSGRNERLHLRGRYVHAVSALPGLSVQLDTRYYHSTVPAEFDYFSPKNFLRVVPLVQMRRFSQSGWMVLGAAGIGRQRSTGAGWTSARLAQLRLESPRSARNLDVFGELLYTNDSISGGTSYDYIMARAGVTLRL